MGHKGQGPWEPAIEDHVESQSNPLATMPAVAAPVHGGNQVDAAVDDDVQVLGSYAVGGSSSSGIR